jgi:HD-GYP domain-containing protein (c-di-GMP phosphodiesterase class II)
MATAATPSAHSTADLEAEVVEEQRVRRLARLAANERLSLTLSNALFLAAALALLAFIPSDRSPSTLALLLLVTAYAVAFHLDFEIGTGSAVPTQLILVPMFFVLPTGSVPLAVAGAIMLVSLFDAVRGSLHLERVFLHLGNAWHAIGPALVLGLAGEGPPELSKWPIYVAALAAQFMFDFATAAAREWLVLGVPPKVQLKAMGIVYLIDAGLAPVGLAVAFAATESSNAVVLGLPLIALLAVFSHERRGRINSELELRDAYRGTAFLLGDVVEADDAYTGAHSREVVDLTLSVVDELGLSPRERRDAEFAALLHDVGKVRIPNSIINKPGALTPEERAVIETHTIEGERMLHRVGGLLGSVGHTIRSCHERYDGTGYPDGLTGDEIPLVARIVACCDAYNAMTTDRPYRPALTREVALDELEKNSGTQFDPVIVEALIATIHRRDAAEAEVLAPAVAATA